LSNAAAVIAQNSHQRRLAESVLSTKVYQIPNCYPNDPVDPTDWEYSSPVIFWAARFQPWKQPEIVAELAADLPEITFVMAGGPGDENLFAKLKQRSENLDNLEVLGHVPFSKIDYYFAAADLFLNTSEFEGFPNTFLQAWTQETSVASLQVDPDGILSSQKIGFVADGSVERLRDHIETLAENPDQLAKLGRASYEYLQKHHTVEAIADRYEQVFLAENTLD